MNPENACVVCLNSMKELLTQRRRYGAVNIQGESPNSITLNYAHCFLLRKISRPKSTNIVSPITNPITTEFIFISRQFFPLFFARDFHQRPHWIFKFKHRIFDSIVFHNSRWRVQNINNIRDINYPVLLISWNYNHLVRQRTSNNPESNELIFSCRSITADQLQTRVIRYPWKSRIAMKDKKFGTVGKKNSISDVTRFLTLGQSNGWDRKFISLIDRWNLISRKVHGGHRRLPLRFRLKAGRK